MILVICLDQKDGLRFNRRRQSKDRLLRQKLLELTRGKALWMNAYSAAQFEETAENLRVDEMPFEQAGAGEFCFVEAMDPQPLLSKAEELIVFRWDKTYPADLRFAPVNFGTLAEVEEFAGYSHETIRQERYLP